jgi:hypothetical protein
MYQQKYCQQNAHDLVSTFEFGNNYVLGSFRERAAVEVLTTEVNGNG